MVLKLSRLELLDIDRLTRAQLIDAVLTSREHLPADLVDSVAQLPVDQLRLLVLTARLICVLRLLQRPQAENDSLTPLESAML
jgi:hypothetical protein